MPPYTIDCHQPACHGSSKVKSPCLIPSSASQLGDELSLSIRHFINQPPPSTRPISHEHCLQRISPNSPNYGLQVHMIMATKCICKLARPQPPWVSLNSLDYGLQVRTIMASKCISKPPRSPFRSASLCSLDHSLRVYLQTHSITTSKYISKFTRSWPWSVSPSALDRNVPAHLTFLSSTACSQSRYGRV